MRNYLAEIIAFHDSVGIKQLSTGQIALWYALMYINNKCAWAEWFTIPNRLLELNTGMSRSGVAKARNQLKQLGYIDFKPNGTKATFYKINTIVKSNQESTQISIQNDNEIDTMLKSEQVSNQISNQNGNQVSNQIGNQNSNQDSITTSKSEQDSSQDSGQIGGTLNKLKLKQNNNNSCSCNNINNNINISTAVNDDIAFISQRVTECTGTFNQQVIFEAITYLDNLPREVIEQALIKTAEKGAKWNYTKTILNDWISKGVNTLEKIKAEELNFQANKQPQIETEEERQARRKKELEEALKSVEVRA